MANLVQPLALSARTLGLAARRLLDSWTGGRVAAAFRSAFYVRTGSRLICVGTDAMEPGPLSLVTSAPAEMDWRACGVRLHQRAAISELEVRVGCHLRISLPGAAVWSPDPIAGPIDPAAAAQGLAAFRSAFANRVVGDGISRFIAPRYTPEQHHYECRAAEVPIIEARRWLIRALNHGALAQREDSEWVRKLTGLGRGLTPAGDDFLGGMMIALHSLEEFEVCRLLWSVVRGCAEKRSNAISLALLSAASEGLGSASLHKAVSGILRGETAAVQDAMPGIDRIGHTSGWDAMTGVVTALDGWLGSQTVSVRQLPWRVSTVRIPEHPVAHSDNIRSAIPEYPVTLRRRR